MNLRQKHKKLKKELERYKRLIIGPTIVFPTEQYEIRTVAVEESYLKPMIPDGDFILNSLAVRMAEHMMDVVEVTGHDDGIERRYLAELKIAIPKTRT